MNRSPEPIGVPVMADNCPAGVIRIGWVNGSSIAAGACRFCGCTRFESALCGDEDAARWLGVHLVDAHRVHAVTVDLRALPRVHTIVRRHREAEIVELVARAWNLDPPNGSLVVSLRVDDIAA